MRLAALKRRLDLVEAHQDEQDSRDKPINHAYLRLPKEDEDDPAEIQAKWDAFAAGGPLPNGWNYEDALCIPFGMSQQKASNVVGSRFDGETLVVVYDHNWYGNYAAMKAAIEKRKALNESSSTEGPAGENRSP